MNRFLLRFLASLLVIPMALFGTACSGDDGGSTDTTEGANGGGGNETGPRPEYAEYCEVAAEAVQIGSEDPLRSAEMQLEVAPDDLKPDLQAMVDALIIANDETASPEDRAQATADAGVPFQRVVATLGEECGIAVDFSG